jgi:hypothetical protein
MNPDNRQNNNNNKNNWVKNPNNRNQLQFPDIQCLYCKKYGHYKRDCDRWYNNVGQYQQGQGNQQNNNNRPQNNNSQGPNQGQGNRAINHVEQEINCLSKPLYNPTT